MFLNMRSRANFFLQIQTYRTISFYITKQQQAAVTNRGSFCSIDCNLVEIVTFCNLRSASHNTYFSKIATHQKKNMMMFIACLTTNK